MERTKFRKKTQSREYFIEKLKHKGFGQPEGMAIFVLKLNRMTTRLTIQDLYQIIDEAASDLLAAAGPDGMVSKDDIEKLLTDATSDIRRELLAAFYHFLRDEEEPYQRVTRKAIAAGVAFVKEKIIAHFEVMPGGLSEMEVRALIEQGGEEALALGASLKGAARGDAYLAAKEVFEQIAANTDQLFFDYLGSEASEPIEAVHIPADVKNLTPESFSKALNLNPDDPKQVVERFVSAKAFFMIFVPQHRDFGLDDRAFQIVQLMEEHLRQHTIVILGKDYAPDVPPQHPAYVVGVADDGSLVGFKSQVIWT